MECIVCGNRSRFSSYLKQSKRHPNYVKCTECGLVFASPQIEIDVGEHWFIPTHGQGFRLQTRLANYEVRYDLLLKHIDVPNPKVLDIGTNDGIFLKFLKSKGIDGVGLELNRKAVDFGRREYGVDISNVPLEKLPDREEFDVVTLFNVFEHLSDPVVALSKIAKITKPNAILAIEVPNIFTPQSVLFRGSWHHFEVEHHWFFDRNTMSRLLRQNGFSLVNATFVPKIVTLARPFYILGWVFGIFYLSKGLHGRVRRHGRIYRYLDTKRARINIGDYLYIIARKVSI